MYFRLKLQSVTCLVLALQGYMTDRLIFTEYMTNNKKQQKQWHS